MTVKYTLAELADLGCPALDAPYDLTLDTPQARAQMAAGRQLITYADAGDLAAALNALSREELAAFRVAIRFAPCPATGPKLVMRGWTVDDATRAWDWLREYAAGMQAEVGKMYGRAA